MRNLRNIRKNKKAWKHLTGETPRAQRRRIEYIAYLLAQQAKKREAARNAIRCAMVGVVTAMGAMQIAMVRATPGYSKTIKAFKMAQIGIEMAYSVQKAFNFLTDPRELPIEPPPLKIHID